MGVKPSVWQRYGYVLASRVGAAKGVDRGRPEYSGVSRADLWPVVDLAYWTNPSELPPDVKSTYEEIRQDPTDFLLLRVTRSSKVLCRIAAFLETSGIRGFDALAVEVESDQPLPYCDHLDVMWYGYEPYARGEWGLLSVFEASEALAHWSLQVNQHGLLPSPESCLAFATDYRKTMGRPGGPEPIAEDSSIDILRVGVVPSVRAVECHVTRPT